MRSDRVTAAALLALAGTGVVHLVLSERRHRDRTVLKTAHLHQHLLTAQMDHPDLHAIGESPTPLDPTERRLHVHRDTWVCVWEAMYRVSALSPAGVSDAAHALFATPEGLRWWARVRETRLRAAVDKRARRFYVLLDIAYQDETGTVLPPPRPAETTHPAYSI